ncbi:MAG: GNAT family N-acetyltransferase [Bacteroidetes bacterium]|nr:GNAT family N-acetyltransferase [Bacteroidota bacterium]
MDNIAFRVIDAADVLQEQVLMLRDRLLRQPLGLSLFDEDLSAEREQTTFVAICGASVVACVLVVALGEATLKVRQMAVDTAFQGRGIGRALMKEAERYGQNGGVVQMVLHARHTAIPFYEACGYEGSGAIFEEVGIPHLLMCKRLK